MPNWISLSFQDSVSPSMEHILFFHDHVMVTLILITIVTFYLIFSALLSNKFNKSMMESQNLEIFWTIFPALLIVFISFPSLKTLYLMEDTKLPDLTMKITGHQWYWSYEFPSLNDLEIECFHENSKMIRLLKTSDIIHLPFNKIIRSLITSSDVIHSWTIPSLGVKMDAIPGRLNQIFFVSKIPGIYSGQCSEICGVNHSFMPILVMFLSSKEFIHKFQNV